MVVSQVGNWMQLVANSWLLLQLTNSPFLLGLQGLFTSLPFIFCSIYGGALADRVDRRRLLIVTQIGLAACSAGLAIGTQLGFASVLYLYAFTAIGAASLAPFEHAVFSAHQMGTCRMGSDPSTSVANPFGELHDTNGVWIGDGSAFPTPSGTNPMISIMALARRTAFAIADAAGKSVREPALTTND